MASGCGEDENAETTIRGQMYVSSAEAVFPYVEECAIRYQTTYNRAYIDVVSSTSRAALVDLSIGKSRVAVLSREPNAIELETLNADPRRVLRTQLAAYDAIAVVVHGDNPVEQLTVSQLKDIFTGKTTNWRELGGKDRPILPLVRDRNSGTYDVFTEQVLKNEAYGANAYPCSTLKTLGHTVEREPGAIGLTGAQMISMGNLKAIKIGEKAEGPFYLPSQESIFRERYPLRRPVVMCYFREPDRVVADLVAGFVSFVTSAMGQQLAVRHSIVPATMPVRVVNMTPK
ncbi:MAG: PstS family phosphate ABC transporter substrate-binding protein [candidate division Zixibacteria bacterium]|nr:PstS family phosphate ABC transporter substrate-binding protein [candidate division Zixibacteria bacterium]